MANGKWRNQGFTLVEMIIYLAIVSTLLVSISYLMLNLLAGQAKSNARREVNYNLQFVSDQLNRDIRLAKDISSLSPSTLILSLPTKIITYNFDAAAKKLIRQLNSEPLADVNTGWVEVTGGFANLSKSQRTKNVGVSLLLVYKNPGNLPDYNASTTADWAVELRGRR